MARQRDFTPTVAYSKTTLKDGDVYIETVDYQSSQEVDKLESKNREWIRPWSISDSRYMASNSITFGIYMESHGVVGKISIYDIDTDISKTAQITYWIDKEFSNKGIVTRAVRLINEYASTTLSLCEVYASVFHGNEASVKVLTKNSYLTDVGSTATATANGLPVELQVYKVVFS